MLPTHEEIMRKVLFTPCTSKEALALWIRTFLGLHLPDCTVSDESNSNPMDLVWEVYDKTLRNDVEDFSRVMAYANRGGFKTLGAAILEILIIFHAKRNVAHMAAVLDQSQKSQEYIRDFFSQPYIRDFKVGDNSKKLMLCRYYNSESGKSITGREWKELQVQARLKYKRIFNYIQIVICNMAGANSAHTEFMTVDEVDVIPSQNKKAYEQAKRIPDPRDGMLPVSLLTSTRKFSYGLVQKEITNAAKTGLITRHWNSVDTTAPCPPSRHIPNESKVNLYIDDANLSHISEDDYKLLDETSQRRYYLKEGFAGCAKCPLFSVCKGRLATHQFSKSPMLKPIPAIINSFRSSEVSEVQTDLMCRQPDTFGLIYPRLNREIHMKTAAQMAEMITGESYKEMTKAQLLKLLVQKEARFYGGMDFGMTHPFAASLAAVYGQNCYVLNVISIPGLELDEKISVCEPLKEFHPTIFGDPEAPADIKTFKRKGFNMREWSKYKGSVKAGIESVRMKLKPALGPPQLFFLKDDPGCELLVERMSKYHFLTDLAGQISDEPDKVDDDECDSLRYLVMNVFMSKGKVQLPHTSEIKEAKETMAQALGQAQRQNDWMSDKIKSLTGESTETTEVRTIKKGNFRFDS